MQLRPTPPTRLAIANYWHLREPGFVIEIEYPECFACHYREEWISWEQRELERCHIVGATVGGSGEVDNLVLLCHRCHVEAPMTNDPAIMLEWIRNRKHYFRVLFESMEAAFVEAGVSPESLHFFQQSEFESFVVQRRLDFHPKASLSDKMAAYALLLREYLMEKRHRLLKERP